MGRPCHGPPVTIKHPAASPRSRGSPCPVTPACPLLPAPLPGGGSWAPGDSGPPAFPGLSAHGPPAKGFSVCECVSSTRGTVPPPSHCTFEFA